MLINIIINQTKTHLIIFNLIFLFPFILSADSLNIEHNYPKEINRGGQFKIEIKIDNSSLSSFAKLEYLLPKNFKTENINSMNAKFLHTNEKVKFIWDKLPEETEISISFNITTDPNFIGLCNIVGSFSYIENQEKKSIETKPIELIINENLEQQNNYSIEENNIEYRLQIAASMKKISVIELKKAFNINYEIKEETHNGMYKYTIGSYLNYAMAKKELKQILALNKLPGAFITAYINKKRTSLKNVLTLTK